MSPVVDWKSTAVISGAGILATWFFSMPAVRPPATGPVARAARAPHTATSTIDIEQEAARLQTHMHQQPRYVEPSRNPFSFGGRRAPGTTRAAATSVSAPPAAVIPPAPPRITLDGIATDTVDGQQQRTAILNTDGGVVLAREGEDVAGYRVGKIGADAVELVRQSDGSALRVALR